jgi:phosphoribosylaminoimidazolecarboxamide formyltransferase/IMP cyclohydrolase
MKAIISTSDRTGIVALGKTLVEAGFELVSTGGTGGVLRDEGLAVTQVADLTGSPEILDGRVKTLHPKIAGGILARRDLPSHTEELAEHGIDTIDLVAVNLYPFVKTVSAPDATLEDALENIDIGGPTMIRSAAKNFPHVIVLVDPSDYGWVSERLILGRGDPSTISQAERRSLARKAFQHVALYDTAVSQYLTDGGSALSDEVTLGFSRQTGLRYGENPHQEAVLYADPLSTGGIVKSRQLHGIEMSFNNYMDADSAWRTVSDFAQPAVTVVKHTNPCGLAVHADQVIAYRRAIEGDSVSAFGGIVGFNRPLTVATAEAMRGVLFDVIIAPAYEPEALKLLERRKRTRVLQADPAMGPMEGVDVRRVTGGALMQAVDNIGVDTASWEVKSKRKPSEAEMEDLSFAWKAAKHVRSNAIVLAKDSALVGMGAGQPNRVTSVHLALRIAGDAAIGTVMASDAFVPFADNIEMAADGGITAVAQPGGSIRDDEVIAAADRLGIALVFTGVRHFKH